MHNRDSLLAIGFILCNGKLINQLMIGSLRLSEITSRFVLEENCEERKIEERSVHAFIT